MWLGTLLLTLLLADPARSILYQCVVYPITFVEHSVSYLPITDYASIVKE